MQVLENMHVANAAGYMTPVLLAACHKYIFMKPQKFPQTSAMFGLS
jgi:hypothetical protein